MSAAMLPPHAVFMQLAGAKLSTRPLYWAARLDLGRWLSGGARSAGELARGMGLSEMPLYRLLRALSAVGVLSEVSECRFELTPVGAFLKPGPGSLRNITLWLNDPRHDRAWDEWEHTLKTGEPGADRAYGMPLFEYLEKNPSFGAIFNDAMSDLASRNAQAVTEAYDFSGVQTLVDVGGGHGALLSAVLRGNPHLKGIVFDLPHVVEGAKARLLAEGLADRCAVAGGDFFEAVAVGDAIVMSHIVHDWPDEAAERILKSCRKALARGGRLLIVETVIPGPNEFSMSKLLDLEMMLMVGGCERTEPEYRALLRRAGFSLERLVPVKTGQSVIEAKPVA